MAISQTYLAARTAEIRARLITYLPSPPPLTLLLAEPRPAWPRSWRWLHRLRRGWWQMRTRGIARLPVSHFTLRHRAELSLVENALLSPTAPVAPRDIAQFLWRLHPCFMRPESLLANQGHRLATAPEQRRALAVRRQIHALTARLDLHAATVVLRAWLGTALQDEPAARAIGGAPARATTADLKRPHVNLLDDYCDYYIRTYGLSRADVLDSPHAWLFQLHRNRLLSEPEGDLRVIDPSALLTT